MEQGCKIIAIGGGSGSGKSVISNAILNKLGKENCSIISQDSYYRNNAKNFDHPDAIEFSLLAQHLNQLKKGKNVEIPRYDYSTHSRLIKTQLVRPAKVIILDGTMVLGRKEIHQHLDAAVFVSVPEEIRLQRRMKRDIEERGRTEDGVLKQWQKQVQPMHAQFVQNSKEFADIIISGEQEIADNAQLVVDGLSLR